MDRLVCWKTGNFSFRLIFPAGMPWCISLAGGEENNPEREYIMVIRNLCGTENGVITYEKLRLELVRDGDGRWICVNDGELKEAVFDGSISREEYREIWRDAKAARELAQG